MNVKQFSYLAWLSFSLLVFSVVSACTGDVDRKSSIRSSGARKLHERLDEPRIPPIEKSDWTDIQRAYLESHEQAGRLFNVFKTAANHPHLARSVDSLAFGHVNSESSTLPPRHRELLILRIGWLCKSEYEWAAHSRVALSIGFTDDELVRITKGPDAPGWTPFEATLLRAVDELHSDAFITDATWQDLSAQYDTQQLMDLVVTVGTYNMVSMMLNSWGVQLDKGFTGFPEGD
jgi:alkylhydroperoxidase family enzyme